MEGKAGWGETDTLKAARESPPRDPESDSHSWECSLISSHCFPPKPTCLEWERRKIAPWWAGTKHHRRKDGRQMVWMKHLHRIMPSKKGEGKKGEKSSGFRLFFYRNEGPSQLLKILSVCHLQQQQQEKVHVTQRNPSDSYRGMNRLFLEGGLHWPPPTCFDFVPAPFMVEGSGSRGENNPTPGTPTQQNGAPGGLSQITAGGAPLWGGTATSESNLGIAASFDAAGPWQEIPVAGIRTWWECQMENSTRTLIALQEIIPVPVHSSKNAGRKQGISSLKASPCPEKTTTHACEDKFCSYMLPFQTESFPTTPPPYVSLKWGPPS